MNIPHSAGLLLILALSAIDGFPASIPLSVTALSSRPSRAGSGQSFTPVLNADGRSVAFVSQAKDLATNGAPSLYLDVFARDVAGGRTALVSVNTNGLGGGEGDSNFPTLSSNGQFVAFESVAANLAAHDINGSSDVFVRDLMAGTTLLVSVGSNGFASANRASRTPIISANGRSVVFESSASDLVSNDTNLTTDLFLRDLVAGTTTLVSANAAGDGTPNQLSDSASISADGRYVAFRSIATNVIAATSNQFGEIFVRDVKTATTFWASGGTGAYFTNAPSGWQSFNPVLDAGGRYVAFLSASVSGSPPGTLLFRYELQHDLLERVGVAVSNTPPAISADGRFISFQTANALMLADADNRTEQIVCATGLLQGVEVWRTPVISADGHRVTFLGGPTDSGPWSLYAFVRETGARELIATTTNGNPPSVLAVSLPGVSADGRRVAFESAAELTEGDQNGVADIFLSDLDAETTELVSQRAPGVGPVTPMGRSILAPRSISEYGRFIAFTSFDNALVDGDENPWVDAFVRDRVSGTNQLLRLPGPSPLGPVRLAFNPILSTNGRYAIWQEARVPSSTFTAIATNIFWLDRETGAAAMIATSGTARNAPGPALSGDGRWVAFVDKRGSSSDVFVRDMLDAGASDQLVSVNRFGNGGGSGDSAAPAFSPDGTWVVFQSKATNLTTNQVSASYWQIFARHPPTARTRLVSTDTTGRNGLSSDCSNASFSEDSRYLVFQFNDFTSGTIVHRHDLKSTNFNRLVCSGCRNASLNDDGRFVAYQYRAPSSSLNIYNVYVRDFLTGEEILSVNSAGAGSGNRHSFSPQISRDGRYVLFSSSASNLATNDTNQFTDLFVYDRSQRATILLSRSPSRSAPADGPSLLPVMGPDGRTVAFVSFANDLAPGDFNYTGDIFVTRLGGPDADADGLDDDWEQTYFNTLTRDGSGDFDGDGASDQEEMRAGTDPTNGGSIFRVLVTSALGGTTRMIHWVAEPGRSYRVQHKRDVSDTDWTYLPGMVTATATTASKIDSSAGSEPRRFYRVLLEP